MTQTGALYHLQTLDSQRDSIRARLAEIGRLLGQDEAVRSAQAALEAAAQARLRWKTRQTDLELERRRLKAEADADEQRLYSGKVLNPRELTDLQDKVAELRRRTDALEEPTLEAMLELEQAEADAAQAEADLARITGEKQQEYRALADEQRDLETTLADTIGQIEQARAAVETKYIGLYDSLRRRPDRRAVVILKANAECTGCGVQVTSSLNQQVRRGEVVACPTCGRILYAR